MHSFEDLNIVANNKEEVAEVCKRERPEVRVSRPFEVPRGHHHLVHHVDNQLEREGAFFYFKGIREAYLIFVIFFTQAKFLENKIYTEKNA